MKAWRRIRAEACREVLDKVEEHLAELKKQFEE